MYIENDKFGEWMQKLYAKLEELCTQCQHHGSVGVPSHVNNLP